MVAHHHFRGLPSTPRLLGQRVPCRLPRACPRWQARRWRLAGHCLDSSGRLRILRQLLEARALLLPIALFFVQGRLPRTRVALDRPTSCSRLASNSLDQGYVSLMCLVHGLGKCLPPRSHHGFDRATPDRLRLSVSIATLVSRASAVHLTQEGFVAGSPSRCPSTFLGAWGEHRVPRHDALQASRRRPVLLRVSSETHGLPFAAWHESREQRFGLR
jgi:hypothetical protein